MVNPHDLFAALSGIEKIKPFLSLALCDAKTASINKEETASPVLMPASGQAIITYVISGEATYCDSTGKQGVLKKDEWAWVISGAGILHSIQPTTADYLAVQVRIALSPALENSQPQSAYQPPALKMPNDPVQVLMGWHGNKRSDFAAPSLINYFVIHLNANQQWGYELPLNHQCAWVLLVSGQVNVNGEEKISFYKPPSHHLDIYERPIDSINFTAVTNSILVLGSAVEFDYELLFQENSVHTSVESLQNGLSGIHNLASGDLQINSSRHSAKIHR